MIRRSIVIKVVAFAVITVLGIGYVLVHYIGVADSLLGRSYTAYVDLTDSGGIFTTASVTYRGVEVGRVGRLSLTDHGLRVALVLNGQQRIPADVRVVIGSGSAIGEQYVDLQPTRRGPPYLTAGSVIPQSHTVLPITTQSLLVSLDRLVNSVPKDKLRTVVAEMGTAMANRGPSLQRLLDSTHDLVVTASTNLPQTVTLLGDGRTVLDTQNALGNDIVDFSQHLASFTDVLRGSDTDLRRLLGNGVPAAAALTGVVHDVDATLPVLLGNLVSLGQVTAVRIPALRQVLIIYPYVVSTSFGLFPGNGTTRFGVPIPPSSVQSCRSGYYPEDKRRLPDELDYPPVRWDAFCREPTSSNIDPRGSRQAPEPGGRRLGDDPSYMSNQGLPPSSQGGSAPSIGEHTFLLASTGGEQRLWGDPSWAQLILGPLT